jgi:hypothetical protein
MIQAAATEGFIRIKGIVITLLKMDYGLQTPAIDRKASV